MATLAQLLKSKLKYNEPYQPSDIEDEQKRLVHFKRLYDYYIFDRSDIVGYTKLAMQNTFKPETIADMQYPLYGLTKKIIDQLAVAYLSPANRYIVVPTATKVEGTETMKIVDPRAQKDNEIYQGVLKGSNINAASKDWNRLAKLLTTVYVEVAFRDGNIEYDIHPPHDLTVRVSRQNYLEPDLVEYERRFGDETYTVRWTATEHKIFDKDGNMPSDLNPWNGENKYGVIPLIPCRLSTPGDHWGDGDTELVGINEQVNIAIASMFYNGLMQSHSQAFGINLGLDEKQYKGGRIRTGPGVVIEANGVRKDDVEPDFRFVTPAPATSQSIEMIDWMIKQAAIMKGLSAQSVNSVVSDASGVSKIVDLAELRERRQDDIEFLRPFEKRLFDVTRTVWNANSEQEISDSAEFGIDFTDPQLPSTALEDMQVKQMKKELGLWSPVMDMIDEDEGIDENQAMAYILQIKGWNRQIDQANG